jgi:hypothetical protein
MALENLRFNYGTYQPYTVKYLDSLSKTLDTRQKRDDKRTEKWETSKDFFAQMQVASGDQEMKDSLVNDLNENLSKTIDEYQDDRFRSDDLLQKGQEKIRNTLSNPAVKAMMDTRKVEEQFNALQASGELNKYYLNDDYKDEDGNMVLRTEMNENGEYTSPQNAWEGKLGHTEKAQALVGNPKGWGSTTKGLIKSITGLSEYDIEEKGYSGTSPKQMKQISDALADEFLGTNEGEQWARKELLGDLTDDQVRAAASDFIYDSNIAKIGVNTVNSTMPHGQITGKGKSGPGAFNKTSDTQAISSPSSASMKSRKMSITTDQAGDYKVLGSDIESTTYDDDYMSQAVAEMIPGDHREDVFLRERFLAHHAAAVKGLSGTDKQQMNHKISQAFFEYQKDNEAIEIPIYDVARSGEGNPVTTLKGGGFDAKKFYIYDNESGGTIPGETNHGKFGEYINNIFSEKTYFGTSGIQKTFDSNNIQQLVDEGRVTITGQTLAAVPQSIARDDSSIDNLYVIKINLNRPQEADSENVIQLYVEGDNVGSHGADRSNYRLNNFVGAEEWGTNGERLYTDLAFNKETFEFTREIRIRDK